MPMRDKTVIGFGHKMGTGKDTAADTLVQNHGYANVKYADKLKELCASLFGWNRDLLEDPQFKDMKDDFWNITPRRALQIVGTEAMRNNVRDDIWVKSLELQIRTGSYHSRYVVTDVRFPNEADAIRQWGGHVFRIDRPGYCGGTHASETALDDYTKWDGVIDNTGTVAELHVAVVDMLTTHNIKLREPAGGPTYWLGP